MKKTMMLLCILFLTANFIFSSDNDTISSNINIENQSLNVGQIRVKLESGESFEKESPFTLRTFKPYLNGSWIGNAVSYGCYRKGQAPGKSGPSKSEVLQDLTIISKCWNLIRVYSSDNDTELILKIIKENNFRIKVMLGIWLENEEGNSEKRTKNIEQVMRGIDLANKFSDIVITINVGNETQVFWSSHRMSSESLIKYIRVVRNSTMVPVTTADDYNFWNKPESKSVAVEIDFIVSHIYPLWNGITLENSIKWMNQIYQDVQKAHHEKLIIVGETGWATCYNSDKKGPGEQGSLIKGEVGLKAQGKFLSKLYSWVNKKKITTFLFEVFDEPWKGGGEDSGPKEIEKHWGVFDEDRMPKESFQKFYDLKIKKTKKKYYLTN